MTPTNAMQQQIKTASAARQVK